MKEKDDEISLFWRSVSQLRVLKSTFASIFVNCQAVEYLRVLLNGGNNDWTRHCSGGIISVMHRVQVWKLHRGCSINQACKQCRNRRLCRIRFFWVVIQVEFCNLWILYAKNYVGAKNESTVVADSEMSVAKLDTCQNGGNFVLYRSIVVKSSIECFEMF